MSIKQEAMLQNSNQKDFTDGYQVMNRDSNVMDFQGDIPGNRISMVDESSPTKIGKQNSEDQEEAGSATKLTTTALGFRPAFGLKG